MEYNNSRLYAPKSKVSYSLFLALLAMLCTSCLKTTDEIPIALSLSETSITFPSSEGEQTLIISSNTNNWTVSSDAASWLTVSPASGAKNGEIKIEVTANTTSSSRMATIYATGTGVQDLSIHVTQSGDPSQFDNDITAESNFGGGDGTQSNPFLIQNAGQLKKLVEDVNNGNSFSNICFILTTDIHVSVKEWIPIGFDNSFKGNFNGNDFTVSGTLKSSKFANFGFFGRFENGSQISNLTINAVVNNEADLNEIIYTGGIAANGSGDIINCRISGPVTGGISSATSYTGGVLGYGGNSIQQCEVSAIISGGGNSIKSAFCYTGGIVGLNRGAITNCEVLSSAIIYGGDHSYNYSSYTGGISGDNVQFEGSITNCTNYAHVITKLISGYEFTGGLSGGNRGIIHSSLNAGNIHGINTRTGGLAGYSYTPAGYKECTFVYSCCTNLGLVNGHEADENNQIAWGEKTIYDCPDGHAKR